MTLKFLSDIGHAVSSPFEHLGNSVSNLGKDVKGAVTTIHNDVKGITKGAYSIGKDVSGGFNQLTSPVGLIVIGGIIVLILFARK